MPPHLAGLGPAHRKSRPVNHIIQPPFQKLKEHFSRFFLSHQGLFQVAAKLTLSYPVNTLKFLFFPQLSTIGGKPATEFAVLSGGGHAGFNGTVFPSAKRNPFPAAKPVDGTDISTHWCSF